MDAFTTSYIECALWASTDESGRPFDLDYDPEDLAPEALAKIESECKTFQEDNRGKLAHLSAETSGHDFFLTRNRHGAGFWDRGLGEVGKQLTEAAHACGSQDLYVGDDGKIYVS